MDYSYPAAFTNSEEYQPQSFSNTNLPMFNFGAGSGMSNVSQSGGSNVGQLSLSRPRGRPRGSKNKPKENVLKLSSVVNTAVLEIPPGSEVVEWLKQFAQSRNIFVTVLGGCGLVSQVAFGHMLSHPILLTENLSLISFTGTAGAISLPEPSGFCSLTASFARLNSIGGIFGGKIWRLITFGTMHVNVLISQDPEVVGAGYTTLT